MSPCCGGTLQEAMIEIGHTPETPGRMYSWRHLDPAIEDRLKAEMSWWFLTPYMAGQQAVGIGVDCVQLVGALLDDLYHRTDTTHIPRLSPDAAIHNAREGFKTIRCLRRSFPSDVVRDCVIEPGDIVVTRAAPDPTGPRRPGHVLIAGPEPFTALHAIKSSGVAMTTLTATRGIVRVYRPRNKSLWV